MTPHFRRFDRALLTFSVVASAQKLSVIQLPLLREVLLINVVSGLTFDPVGIYLTIDVSSSAL